MPLPLKYRYSHSTSTLSPAFTGPLPAGISIRQLQPTILRICPLACWSGSHTSFPSAFPLKKRRLLLFFEKPVTAVRVSRRSFRSGSPIFNDRISRTNISNGIAAENGLPESPINKTPSFSAARVGIPGLMAIP